MKILIVGNGGREHALAWKIAQSPSVKTLYCAPGNAGIAKLAQLVPISSEDVDRLLEFALEKQIDLTVVGPEIPLALGIVDRFEKRGLRIFGPTQKAAEIEASKSFAKRLMQKYGIPTASGETFVTIESAIDHIKQRTPPMVVKADGLAAGKGVVVCDTQEQALNAVRWMMSDKAFGNAGASVLIEDRLEGEEASFLAFTDGEHVLPLPSSQDHKTIFDNDKGPNTGGMGAYSPTPVVDAAMHERIMNSVMIPAVKAMAAEGRPYKGVLYAGLMIQRNSVHVVEFNARFGDPETQPLMRRIASDIVPVMEAVVEGRLNLCSLEIDPRPAVCVVMASQGYPGAYPKGMPISGIEAAGCMKDVVVFHAGTAQKDGRITTAGGRVLGVTAIGDTIKQAIDLAYAACGRIQWEGAHHRSDIGRKALHRMTPSPLVGIVMGSDTDYGIMKEAADVLTKFGIPYEITIASAHRTPQRAVDFAAKGQKKGFKVIIAGAGHAAHLAGVLAAHTTLPIIGVPIDSSALKGMDALLSTVQMPPGVPVATMAIGKPGARNAGILAVQILAASNRDLENRLWAFKAEMADQVEQKARNLIP